MAIRSSGRQSQSRRTKKVTHVSDHRKAVSPCRQPEYQSHCNDINICIWWMYGDLLGQRPDEIQNICITAGCLNFFLRDLGFGLGCAK